MLPHVEELVPPAISMALVGGQAAVQEQCAVRALKDRK